MTNQVVARDLLAFLCSAQGLATMAIDLNRAHATNPAWPGHARFHVVWQTASVAWIALLELLLLLAGGPFQEQRFYFAAILTTIPMLGFFSALIGRRLYAGTLSDPNGMPTPTITFLGARVRVDLNLAAVVVGMLTLVAIVALYRYW